MRRRKLLYIGGAGVAVVVFVVVAALVLAGGGGTGFASLEKSKTCTVKSFPSEGRGHTYRGKLLQPTDTVPYRTDPATSGSHYQIPAPWGVYSAPIPAVIRVHNLEHGGIELLYGDKVSEADRAAAEQDVRGDWKLMLMAPDSELGDKVYYVAWQHWIACTGYQATALDEAQKRWRDKGPESPIDPEQNKQPDFGD